MSTFRLRALAVLIGLTVWGGAKMSAEPAATPRLQWAFDGPVYATARVGTTLYVGGAFRNVLPPSGVLGRLYAVSPATGIVVPSTLPNVGGEAFFSIVADGAGGYYMRGNLTIGSGGLNRVVHIRSDGSVDPAFQSPPQLNGYGTMVRVGPSLILAGFNQLDGQYPPLVALDPVTGARLPWTPALPPDDDVALAAVVSGIGCMSPPACSMGACGR